MKKTLINPENHTVPRGAYSPGLLVEHNGMKTLYVTGQLAVSPDGLVVAPNDVAAQTEYVFQLLGSLLGVAGMDYGDIVKVQTFLTNMTDFERFTVVRDRYFAESRPVRTLLEVKGLAHEGCCVEIEIVAIK
jgi:2-iminobutanoate/2-iminopropanoate deaminase